MSAWPSARDSLSSWRRGLGVASGLDVLLVPILGALMLLRVLTDDLSAPDSRHTGSLNLSGAIALVFMLAACGLLLRRRRGVLPTVLSVAWLCIWTAVAVNTNGASSETLREGVRELSVLALAVIVYNARGVITVPISARLVQLTGFAPALIVFYQLATFTGIRRPYGTFAHSNSAAMFFAIAAVASLWRYLSEGRRRADALLATLFTAALVATVSIDGLATLVAMFALLGTLHSGSARVKLGPLVVATVAALAFFATPLGAKHLARESSTSLATAERGEPNTSLAWRLHKWKTLLPEWERSPIYGRGLGTTTTTRGAPGNIYANKPPHNEYIRYLVETGVVGVLILLWAAALLIRRLARKRRALMTAGGDPANTATLAIVIVGGCLVNSLADNTLLNSPTCYAAALIVAAALSMPDITTRQVRTLQAA